MGRRRSSGGGIDRKELMWIVTELCRTADKRNTLPILRNVLVETLAGGRLTLRATDLDLHISYTTGWTLPNEFRVLVDAHKLKTLLGSDGDEVTLSHVPKESGFGKLIVTVGGVTAKLPSIDPDDFPNEPEMKKENAGVVARLDGEEIVDALGFVNLAMSQDETRFNLHGVHLDGKRGRIVTVDGHRCHMASVDGIVKDANVIVRDVAASALHRVLKKRPGLVIISQAGDVNLIVIGDWRMTTKIAGTNFPSIDHADVENSSLDVFMVSDGKALTKVLRQARKLAHENCIKLDLREDGAVAMVGDPADGDLVEMDLPLSAEVWDEPGMNMLTGYNMDYLLEAVSFADGQVKLGLERGTEKKGPPEDTRTVKSDRDNLGPMVVTPRKGWRVLLMPMRI